MAQTLGLTRITAPAWRNPFSAVVLAHDVWRQRRHLSGLDAHLLRDIGLNEAAAQNEANRPIWDVPASWRR